MFIPLNNVKENGWPNVLVIGDTANVFFLLSLLAPYKLNVFIADTGVDSSSPLHFRRGTGDVPDVAAAYYDFFDSPYRIGAGILRRMDFVAYTAGRGYVAGWTRRLRVPSAYMKRRPDGAIFEIEGAVPDAGGLVGCRTAEGAIAALLLGLAGTAKEKRYSESSTIVTIDGDGRGHMYPPAERKAAARVEPEETVFSAWDSLVEVLGPDESALIDMPDADGPLRASADKSELARGHAPGPKLIELGVPELHVLKILKGGPSPGHGPRERYIELTGDAPRVFDGVL